MIKTPNQDPEDKGPHPHTVADLLSRSPYDGFIVS